VRTGPEPEPAGALVCDQAHGASNAVPARAVEVLRN
jgi:hypothetical protein